MARFDAYEHQAATAGDWGQTAHDAHARMQADVTLGRLLAAAKREGYAVADVHHVTSLPPTGSAAKLTGETLEVLLLAALSDHGNHMWDYRRTDHERNGRDPAWYSPRPGHSEDGIRVTSWEQPSSSPLGDLRAAARLFD